MGVPGFTQEECGKVREESHRDPEGTQRNLNQCMAVGMRGQWEGVTRNVSQHSWREPAKQC